MEPLELHRTISTQKIKEGDFVEVTIYVRDEKGDRKESTPLYFGRIEDPVVNFYRRKDSNGKVVTEFDHSRRDDYFCHYFIREVASIRRHNPC